MKKLMFIATAALCGAVMADDTAIVSANIVGYAPTGNDAAPYPIFSGQFFGVGGAETFDLVKCTIPGTKTWEEIEPDYFEWVCDYMNPDTEFIRVLNPESLAEVEGGRYSYVSAEYLLDNFGDVSEEDWESTIKDYKWAIGWWKFGTVKIFQAIAKGDASAMVASATFPNGTAFVGNFAPGQTRNFQSNGEVATAPFAFNNDEAPYPVFASQLPVDIDLTDMAIPGSKTWEEIEPDYFEWVCDYMNPDTEFIRFMNPETLAEVEGGRYSYVSAEYLLDNFGDVSEEDWESTIEEYKWAIGWWKFGTVKIFQAITKGDDSAMVAKGDFTVKAGYGCIGNFASGQTRQVNFPGAIDVPSKK